ncbi:hypothetical protein ACH40E_06825 [Streptomyces acidicola]|uniref:hypothetical protein n=1 Tax=Streptomyces acidicola TaxID=2596892 RepID=UPI00378D68A8
MARPGDWSALGLGSDPTPGDPDRIDDVITSQDDLVELADTIDSGLTEIMNTTDGAFVGKTADALREVIDGDLRNYVSTFRQAHVDVQSALRTYAGVMREQQQRADAALTAAAALAEDDEEGRETHKATAEDAREILEDAASTAADAIRDAADSIASPVDECEEIWKALGWLALILVIPAMIVGGPLALFTIALNVALLIKTAVDFSQGKASITDLVLSIIGVIAPTTKGINLANVWKGLKGAGIGAWKGGKNLFLGGPNALGLFTRLTLGMDDVFRATNIFLNNGLKGISGLKVPNMTFMPGIKGFTMSGGAFGKTFSIIPAASELTVINLMGAKTFFGLRSAITGLNGIRGLGSSLGHGMVNGVRGLNGLRFFLPVAADEMGRGLAFALKIGVIDRGIFGMYRYGAFAGGQFLGATSKISGGVAAGLDLFRPGAGLGALPSINTGQFTPNLAGGGVGSGLSNLPSISTGSIGTINLSGFNGLGGKLSASVPGIDAKLVDIPATGGLGNVRGIDLPQLGPVSSVTTPGTGGLNVPSLGAGVGGLDAGQINVPSLGSVGAGATRINLPTVSVGQMDGLASVSTPSVGAVNVPTAGQVDVPSVGQINVPSLSSVSSGPTAIRIDMPSVDARITDIPSAGASVSRIDMPSVGQLDIPSVNPGRVDAPSVSAAHVDIPSVNVARVDVPSVNASGVNGVDVNVARVEVPSVNTGGVNGVHVNVGRVDVPAVNAGGVSGVNVNVGRVDVASVNAGGINGVDVNGARVDVPSVNAGGAHTGGVDGARVDVPAASVNGPAVTHVDTPSLNPAQVDAVGTGRLANPAGDLNATPVSPVSHITPTPMPTPANSGGLHGPGNGAIIVDVPNVGRVDLTALVPRTVEVRMMSGQQFNFLHTFTNLDASLPGVSVRVTPGTGPHGTNVTVNTGGMQGVTAWHDVDNGADVLRVRYDLPNNGGTDQWTYSLNAANNWAPVGGVQHFAPGTLGNSHVLGAMPPANPGLNNAVPSSSNAPVPAPANAVPPTTLNVPGVNSASIQVQFGGTPGQITGVSPVQGHGMPTITTQHLPGAGPNGADLLRVDHAVSGVEVRQLDLTLNAGGLTPVRDERLITLAGGPHGGTTVGIDLLNANAVRHVSGGQLPPGQARYVGGELNIPTGGGFQLYDPATGLPGRAGTQLTGGGIGNNAYVIPAPGGTGLHLTDAVAVPHPGGSVTSVGGVYHVRPPQTPAGVVNVHTTNGNFTHQAITVQGGGYIDRGTQQLVDAGGARITNANVTPQPGNAFRIDHGNRHIVVGPDGRQTHHVISLQGTNDLVHVPNTPTGTLVRVDGLGQPQGAVTRVGSDFHVPAGNNRTTVYDGTGAHTNDLVSIQGGPLAGSRLDVNLTGTPTRVVDGGGVQTHNVVPLQGTNDLVLVPNTAGGGPVGRVSTGGVDQGAVTRVGSDFHVPAGNNRTTVYDGTGAHTNDLVSIQGGPLAGSRLDVNLTGTPTRVVDGGGVQTHNVVPLQGTNDLVLVPNTAGGGPVGRVSTGGVDQGAVTRVGNEFHVPGANNRTTVYDGTGTHTNDLLSIQGGPLGGRDIRLGLDGTPRMDNGIVVPQPNGSFRIQQGNDHIVVNAQGVHTDNVASLPPAQGSGLVHTPATGANPVPVLKDVGGTPVPHASVTAGPGGSFNVTRAIVDGSGGPIGRSLQFHPGGAVDLLDGNLAKMDDVLVSSRPGGGGFRISQDGEVLLVNPNGRVDFAASDTAGTGTFRVLDGQGTRHFDAVQLSDSAGVRFVRTDTHALLDGDLAPVPPGGHNITPQPGGGYRIDGFPGVRAGEYKLYDNLGKLTEQRFNVVNKGAIKPNEYLKVTHPTDGVTKPTWERVRLDAAGTPQPVTGARNWYDTGKLDAKGLGNGQVRLTSDSGVEVFQRRTLPDGHVVDAYHSPAGVGTFGKFNQRGVWTEYDAGGTVTRFGTRHWGESGRSWFDVTTSKGMDTRVRHFQETPDGGHILAKLDNSPLTQSFAKTTWTRFDGEFRPIAEGTRNWGPGRGYTDTMVNPKSGESVLVHEKWGRFTWSVHDVRRFHQTEIGADGVPKKDYTSWSTHGKENGRGLTLKDGDFLETRRFAEQRPPVSFRWLMSSDYRAMSFDAAPWLKWDSKLQVHHFTQTPAGGGASVHGVRFVSQNTTTDMIRTGDVVRETRKLTNGDTLTVGDVKMPDGVNRQNNYLPWSQGDGKPQGHRTYDSNDFTTPTIDGRRVVWQDKVAAGLNDGDWYSPNVPGRQWNVVRSGLDDGTVVEYRPAPGQQTPAHLNNGDWTRYDHHGLVVGRQDTWPNPTGTGNDIQVTSVNMLNGDVRWTDSLGNGGIRKLNHNRGDVTPWGWDREAFQDFDAAGQLVRDHRITANGTSIDSWSVPNAGGGGRTWHWNKVDADGTVNNFGTGGADRIRQWFDAGGNQIPDWRPGASWQDQVPSLGNRVIQEIPAKPAGTSWFTDAPHRVREYVPDPAGLAGANPHVWKEYENGIEIGRKVELDDGTFLESEDWHKQWRRYGTDGVTMIDERTMAGFVWHTDTFGRVSLIGRETNFTGVFNEYRGFNRMWREGNNWEWGATTNGVSTYTPFINRAARSIAIDMVQEWILDFAMNLTVYGIIAAATGTPFGGMDVAKAAFGASVSAGVKGTFSAGHFAAYRGGPWKTGLSQIDQGQPYTRRPNDDNWGTEYGGNEKVTRWRSGTYDFGMGLVSGMTSGFIGAAASSAIFGVKDKDGNTVHLSGGDALLAGLVGMAGSALGGVTTGLGKTIITQNLGGRWYHRQGPFDIFVVGGVGKMIDKLFSNLWIGKTLTQSTGPDYYTNPGGDSTAGPAEGSTGGQNGGPSS